jgi:hypothetical protein
MAKKYGYDIDMVLESVVQFLLQAVISLSILYSGQHQGYLWLICEEIHGPILVSPPPLLAN